MRKRVFLVFLTLGIIISCAHNDISNNRTESIPPVAATDQKEKINASWMEGIWVIRLESAGADNVVYYREDFTYRVISVGGMLFPVREIGRQMMTKIELGDNETVRIQIFGKTRAFIIKNRNLIEGTYLAMYNNMWPRENRITMMRVK